MAITENRAVYAVEQLAGWMAAEPRHPIRRCTGPAARSSNRSPRACDRIVMVPARDQQHVAAGLMQASADDPADRPRADDHEPHRVRVKGDATLEG